MPEQVLTGLDRLDAGENRCLKGLRWALASHPAAVTRNLKHSLEVMQKQDGWTLAALFGPQHGWFGHTQDNMIEWPDETSQRMPVFSLYGEHRRPTAQMLEGVDGIVVDFQDVGCRVYTFIQTLFLIMEACHEFGKKLIVLDRPNPIGHAIEGPGLDHDFRSFIGLTNIPLRHGQTIGQLARRYNGMFEDNVDLQVVELKGYDRDLWFDQTGLPWVAPSPNMPCIDTAVVYPGMVLLEGTTISEGRGTTRPFETFGAPGLDNKALHEVLNSYKLPGCAFREVAFMPTFHKFYDRLCQGLFLHVTDRTAFKPVLTGMAVMRAMAEVYPGFSWLYPPYEYEYDKWPIDILAGGPTLRKMIDNRVPFKEIQTWLVESVHEHAVMPEHL